MLQALPAPILFLISLTLLSINTAICGSMVILISLLKVLMPTAKLRAWISVRATWFMKLWAIGNAWIVMLAGKIQWQVEGLENLSKDDWYLLISNHVSGFDIAALCYAIRNHIPMLKFFLKHELLYVPFLGMACWALDMPFMRRYSPAKLRKNPNLKGKDLESTKKSCERFRHYPTSVINFVEGTRYTKGKAEKQQSPYKHLLKPKSGGVAYALATLGNQFNKLLNITIVYPDGDEILKKALSGRLTFVKVIIETIEVPKIHADKYTNDPAYRAEFQRWLNELWQQKDRLIEQELQTINAQKSPQ
ncbi:acyltransferase [Paraferrimonas sp. SM1919]|uniref:acyltransferase n=1 Tax=Paraferrimonas sp. SM1919 TaxID=2662263 RepID=UPI0013D63935|nr:acyltransferase [Paraferrimonas sp. SM1919]